MYLANLDSGTDRVTSQNIERTDYYWDHEKADTKMFSFYVYSSEKGHHFFPDSDAAVISLYQSVTDHIFLTAIWFKTGSGGDQRYILLYTY